jgi:hypothetical protein
MKYLSSDIENKIRSLQVHHFPNSFPMIFYWDELENLLNLRPFVNNSRFHIISKEDYVWKNQTWLSDVNTYPPSMIQTEIKKHVCFLIDCSRVNKHTNSICRELENVFSGSAVDAHIYFDLSAKLNGGFGIHKDTSHNLIIQIEGETEFSIWGKDQTTEEIPNTKINLNPGDGVFIPKDVYHMARSLSPRLSISFPISIENQYSSQDRNWVRLGV